MKTHLTIWFGLLTLSFASTSALGNRFEVANVAAVKTAQNEVLIESIVRIAYGRSQGSGVFVSPYHVLTAAHVVKTMDCPETQIQTLVKPGVKPIGAGRNLFCDDILFIDEQLDIALLATDRAVQDFIHLPNVDIIEKDLALTAIGYTTSGHLARSDRCSVSAPRGHGKVATAGGEIDLSQFFMTDCLLSPGMSGGPVLDLSNPALPSVIGVNAAIISETLPGPMKTAMGRLVDAIQKYGAEFNEVYRMAGERWEENVEP